MSENSTVIVNTLSPDVCTLSPHARALSTVLTAFIGSIVGGMTSGMIVAFYTAWICWMASLRILIYGAWAMFDALRGNVPFQHLSDVPQDPTVLGWVGLIWSTVYTPIVQILWLVENWNRASGSLKIVRAIGVSVAALPLTMDTRARYGAALGEKFGEWSRKLFNCWTATCCLILGVVASIELVLGAKEAHLSAWIIVIYILVMCGWTYGSLDMVPPRDAAGAVDSISDFLWGLGTGAFAGAFVATPAFVILMRASDTPGDPLDVYLKCESVAVWEKLVSILP